MHLNNYTYWKRFIMLVFAIAILITKVQALPYFVIHNQSDTLEKVSMMFMVNYDTVNSMDLKNHPVFKSSSEEYRFTTPDELADGLQLSLDGTITWSPTAEQFNKLISSPIQLAFSAQTKNEKYIIGQIRIIGEGELVTIEEPAELDSIKSVTGVLAELFPKKEIEPITIQLPTVKDWDATIENEPLSFEITASGGSGDYKFELLEPEFMMENLDQYGNFDWTPDYDFVTSEEEIKSITLKLRVFDTNGDNAFESITLYVSNVNRPPVVNELPTFYIQFNTASTYQLKKDGLAYDPDGDSIIFKPVLVELPEGMVLNGKGEISWEPSKKQFNFLARKPIYLSFTVEDFPYGAKTIGQVKIAVSQADLPPQITVIPNKNSFELKENEELQLSFFITDPNGEDDLRSFDFVTENRSISDKALVKKENWQYDFSWTPGFDFIKEVGEKNEFDISFFAIDKEGNRTEKNILVSVEDTENLLEKDRLYYDQYRTVLERAWDLILQLDEKEKEYEKLYKTAKKGKKNRAITTAGLGALTGLSPVFFLNNPDGQKIAAGLGGTATATLGTLEASNVIGEPPSDIMRDLNYISQKRSDLMVYGNIFASKYALPLKKRDSSFPSDLRSLSIHLNLKDISNLDLDASWENSKSPTSKNIKKIFKDFNPDPRFEDSYNK